MRVTVFRPQSFVYLLAEGFNYDRGIVAADKLSLPRFRTLKFF